MPAPVRRTELVALERAHVDALELPPAVHAHGVRDGLAQMLKYPQWSWTALIHDPVQGPRVAGVGGFIWLSSVRHCWAAVAPAPWVTPMMWRPFIRPIFEKLELAHRAGATCIETDVLGPFSPGHRLVMALGFVFQGLRNGHDTSGQPSLVYARHRDVPALPRRVEKYRRLLHVQLLRELCPDVVGPALAADLRETAS